MKPKNKALLFNFLSFLLLFLSIRYLFLEALGYTRIIAVVLAAVITLVIAPKFSAVKTKEGMQLFVKWLFIKGVKKI